MAGSPISRRAVLGYGAGIAGATYAGLAAKEQRELGALDRPGPARARPGAARPGRPGQPRSRRRGCCPARAASCGSR